MSPFQEYKLQIVQLLHLAKDAIHIYIGFACFMLAVALFRGSLARAGGAVAADHRVLSPGEVD